LTASESAVTKKRNDREQFLMKKKKINNFALSPKEPITLEIPAQWLQTTF